MKYFTTLLLFLIYSIGNAQTTYESNVAEHWFNESDSESVREEMKRYITIVEDTITITSYGNSRTDIQRWVIEDRITANSDAGVMEVMPSYLASGEPNLYPATFTIYYEIQEQVAFITCMIPRMVQSNLPDGAPIGTKFYID